MPEPKAVHIDTRLTNFSVQYKNEESIWRSVMPPVKVSKRSDVYTKYAKGNVLAAEDDMLSPIGMPNEVDWEVSTDSYSVRDHGYGDYVSVEEEENADAPIQPLLDTTEILLDKLELKQEQRVASVVFNTSSYASGYSITLTGNDQWNSGHSSANPMEDLLMAIETPHKRANVLVFGEETWRVVRQNQKLIDSIRQATRTQSSAGGLLRTSELLELFELDAVLVGRMRYRTSKKGQPETYARVWGKHCAALYVDFNASIKSMTFGKTFIETDKTVYREFDGKRGVKGAWYIKAAWNSDEKVVASDCGFLIENAIA